MVNPVLVEVTRGGEVESRHRAAAVVALPGGEALLELGDTSAAVFPRSAVKPFQALALVAAGGVERFGLTDAEIALMCASHYGEPRHVEAAASILARIGLDEDALACGPQWPAGEFGHALAARGERPRAIHNNCSGKHAGMLALAVLTDADPSGYVSADHPVQRRIAEVCGKLCGVSLDAAPCGIDGCSVPTWAVPLGDLAKGFARFANGEGLETGLAEAARRIRAAVAAHPYMIAGKGSFGTGVLERTGPRALVKGGAEGVFCAALPDRNLGIAVKCDDGAGRAAEVVMANLLLAFGAVDADDMAFNRFLVSPVLNSASIHTGDVRPAAALLEALQPATASMMA